jgi:hypothetical protein
LWEQQVWWLNGRRRCWVCWPHDSLLEWFCGMDIKFELKYWGFGAIIFKLPIVVAVGKNIICPVVGSLTN